VDHGLPAGRGVEKVADAAVTGGPGRVGDPRRHGGQVLPTVQRGVQDRRQAAAVQQVRHVVGGRRPVPGTERARLR
jgi:hypothetical protein